MMLIWASYLKALCGLRLKEGSYEVITASTRGSATQTSEFGGVVWKRVSMMLTLGQSILATGSSVEDRQRIHRSWEAAFWRKSKVLMCRKINVNSRLQFWKVISQGIGNFQYCMWTPIKSAAARLEAWHNKILQRIVGMMPTGDETAERFCRRRNRVVADCRKRFKLTISEAWALALVRWVEHLERHPEMPASVLLKAQTDLWLQTMRALRWTVSSDPMLLSGATGTRSGPGQPIRWSSKWLSWLQEEHGTQNAFRSKTVTERRADFVHDLVFK